MRYAQTLFFCLIVFVNNSLAGRTSESLIELQDLATGNAYQASDIGCSLAAWLPAETGDALIAAFGSSRAECMAIAIEHAGNTLSLGNTGQGAGVYLGINNLANKGQDGLKQFASSNQGMINLCQIDQRGKQWDFPLYDAFGKFCRLRVYNFDAGNEWEGIFINHQCRYRKIECGRETDPSLLVSASGSNSTTCSAGLYITRGKDGTDAEGKVAGIDCRSLDLHQADSSQDRREGKDVPAYGSDPSKSSALRTLRQ